MRLNIQASASRDSLTREPLYLTCAFLKSVVYPDLHEEYGKLR